MQGLCEGPQQVFEEENIDYQVPDYRARLSQTVSQRVPLDDNSFVIDLLLGDPGILSVLEAALVQRYSCSPLTVT